jgi:hypothetical protein
VRAEFDHILIPQADCVCVWKTPGTCTAQGIYYNVNSGYLGNNSPVLDELLRSLRYKGLLKVGMPQFRLLTY